MSHLSAICLCLNDDDRGLPFDGKVKHVGPEALDIWLMI